MRPVHRRWSWSALGLLGGAGLLVPAYLNGPLAFLLGAALLAAGAGLGRLRRAQRALQQQLEDARHHTRRVGAVLEQVQGLTRSGTWELELPAHSARWDERAARLHGAAAPLSSLDAYVKLVVPEDRGAVLEAVRLAQAEPQQPRAYRYRVLVEGRPRHLRGVLRADPGTGEGLGRAGRLYGAVVDTTTEQELQDQLVAAREDTLVATQARNHFLAQMDEELLLPVRGVLGGVAQLRAAELGEPHRELLRGVSAGAEVLERVLRGVLDLAHLEAGQLTLERRPFALQRLVQEVLHAAAHEAHERAVELICDLAPELPEPRLGDPGRLRQLLLRLVHRLLASGRGGELTLRVRRDLVDTEQLRVTLSGSQAAGGAADGSALHLALCQELVALMGGRFWSEPLGAGFHFHMTLALPPAPGAEAPALPDELRGRRVLVVDDNGSCGSYLVSVLRTAGSTAVLVGDGAAALRSLRWAAEEGCPYQLAVIDAALGDEDGAHLCAGLDAVLPADAPPLPRVLLLGAHRGAASLHLAPPAAPLGRGDRAVLLKPVTAVELLGAAERLLKRSAHDP